MEFADWGAWTTISLTGEEEFGDVARVVEDAGYASLWLGDSPRLAQLRGMLEGSKELIVGTSIVNIWSYDPTVLVREYQELEVEFPGRVCVGIGVGHPEAVSDYRRPLTNLERFLDAVDAEARTIPVDRRIVASLAPKSLAMAAQRSLGTIPYFTSVAHTRWARAQLGPDPKLIPLVTCVIDEDVERARAVARAHAADYLELRNYTKALLDHGGFEQRDLENGGSDRLIDQILPHGSPSDIAAALRAHREAGADQVCLHPIGGKGIPAVGWRQIATALG